MPLFPYMAIICLLFLYATIQTRVLHTDEVSKSGLGLGRREAVTKWNCTGHVGGSSEEGKK